MTGVWVCSPEKSHGFTDVATVRFFPFTLEEAAEYVASGESMDKAGGYGIQGLGMRFVEGIDGDFYTVMGLPGGKLRRFLLPFFDF
jgi:septum formation protein